MSGEEKTDSFLPESHAYVVENRLRKGLDAQLKPMVDWINQNREHIKGLKEAFKVLEINQEKIRARQEDSELLREMFLTYEVTNRKMYNDYYQKSEASRKSLTEVVQLTQLHENKIVRLTDEVNRMYAAREQMQREVREFELLAQDISKDCQMVVQELRADITETLAEQQFKLDHVEYETRDTRELFRHQKQLYETFDKQLGWQKYNIDHLVKLTEELPVLAEQVVATDNYLQKVLPLKIQTQIFGNCKQLVSKDRDLRLDLLEYQEAIYEELHAKKDEEEPFNKAHFVVPAFEYELSSLRLGMKKKAILFSDDPKKQKDSKQAKNETGTDEQASSSQEKTGTEDDNQNTSEKTEEDHENDGEESARGEGRDGEKRGNKGRKKKKKKAGKVKDAAQKGERENADSESQSHSGSNSLETLDDVSSSDLSSVTSSRSSESEGEEELQASAEEVVDVLLHDKKLLKELAKAVAYLDVVPKIKKRSKERRAPRDKDREYVQQHMKETFGRGDMFEHLPVGQAGQLQKGKKRKAAGSRLLHPHRGAASSESSGRSASSKSNAGRSPSSRRSARRSKRRDRQRETSGRSRQSRRSPGERESPTGRQHDGKRYPREQGYSQNVNKRSPREPEGQQNLGRRSPRDPAEYKQQSRRSPHESRRRSPRESSDSQYLSRRSPPEYSAGSTKQRERYDKDEKSPFRTEDHRQRRGGHKDSRRSRSPKRDGKARSKKTSSRKTDNDQESSGQSYDASIDRSMDQDGRRGDKRSSNSRRKDTKRSDTTGRERKRKNRDSSNDGRYERRGTRKMRKQDIQEAIMRLEDQVNYINKKFRLKAARGASSRPDKTGEKILSEVNEDRSDDRSDARSDVDSESEESVQFVNTNQFKQAQDQMKELKSNISSIKSKFLDFERELLKGVNSGDTDLNTTVSLTSFHNNLRQFEKQFTEKLEHVDLLKDEMKHQLKRLQKQHFEVNKDYETQSNRCNYAIEKLMELNKKMVLSEAAVATIFKLLRIQYALSHQDERDKQNIFLAGFEEVGQAQRPVEQHADEQVTTAALDELLSRSAQDIESKIDGQYTPIMKSIEVSDTDPSNNNLQQLSKIFESTFDSTNGSSQVLHGVKNRKNKVNGSIKTDKNINSVKMKMLEGVKNEQGQKLLSFDSKCLQGCDTDGNGKNVIKLMKAFKTACLSYKPSQVRFDQKIFDRTNLIEAQGHLLYLAMQHLSYLDFDKVEQTILGTSNASTIRELDAELAQLSQERQSVPPGIINHFRTEVQTSDGKTRKMARDPFRTGQNPQATTLYKCNSNEQLQTGTNTQNLDMISIVNDNHSKMTNKKEQMGHTSEHGGVHKQQLSVSNSIVGSLAQTTAQDRTSSRNGALKGKDRLNKLINLTAQLPDSGLIPLSRSKEYAKLASQVPNVFQIQSGQKVLNESDLADADVATSGTPQDQYQHNLQQLRHYQKHLRAQNQLNVRSLTSLDQSVASSVVQPAHAQSTVLLQKYGQGVEDSMKTARYQGILYSSVNRLQQNQTFESKFSGLRSPSAVQFNFQSGANLNAQMLTDIPKYISGHLENTHERKVAQSQKKLASVKASAGIASVERERKVIRLKNLVSSPLQTALTPSSRADSHLNRRIFAEKFGLIGQAEAAQHTDDSRKLGAAGMSDWEARTNQLESSQQQSAKQAEAGKTEGKNDFNECLSSRPLKFATKLDRQFALEHFQYRNIRSGIETPMRKVNFQETESQQFTNKKVLSIHTDGSFTQPKKTHAATGKKHIGGIGQILERGARQGNKTVQDIAIEGFKIQDILQEKSWLGIDAVTPSQKISESNEVSVNGQSDFRVSRGFKQPKMTNFEPCLTSARIDSTAIPSLQSPKINAQEFSPRIADANLL